MQQKLALIVTFAFIILGAALFIATDGIGKQQRNSGQIYQDMQIKTNYLNGDIKLFVLVDAKELKPYTAAEGVNTPADSSMVLGSAEAQMMKNEKLITGAGSSFEDFFGIKTTVGGILLNRSAPIDDMHFLSVQQYAQIKGEEGRVGVAVSPEGMGKLFYVMAIGEEVPIKLDFAEGSLENYKVVMRGGKEYYPVIVGSQEAAMMRSENLFASPGDVIEGFFGQNVHIAGILKENKTVIDMMHITPFTQEELR